MTVRERVQRRSEFKSVFFVIRDPEIGNVRASVSEFIGPKNDGTTGLRDDHPAMSFEVAKEEA